MEEEWGAPGDTGGSGSAIPGQGAVHGGDLYSGKREVHMECPAGGLSAHPQPGVCLWGALGCASLGVCLVLQPQLGEPGGAMGFPQK